MSYSRYKTLFYIKICRTLATADKIFGPNGVWFHCNSYQVCSHIMYFEWGSEFCDPTEADLDDGIDVELNDNTSTDPGIIVMYDA